MLDQSLHLLISLYVRSLGVLDRYEADYVHTGNDLGPGTSKRSKDIGAT